MLRLYRICRNIYDPSDPTGASKTPGRWHILGQRVLYFCSSLSMCVLELKANSISFNALRQKYHYTSLDIDNEGLIEAVPENLFTKNWVSRKEATQNFGSEWYTSGRTLIMKVYSAVLTTDSNFILNTDHPYFSKLVFEKTLPIPLDSRVN